MTKRRTKETTGKRGAGPPPPARWIWGTCPKPPEAEELMEGHVTLTGTLEIAELWGGKTVYKRLRRTLPGGEVREMWSRMK